MNIVPLNLTARPATGFPGAAVERELTAGDETNHRFANSLQLLSSLVSLEARDVTDPAAQAVLASTVRRIAAIAGVHRQLYQGPGDALVDLGAYLMSLGRDLEQSFGFVGRRILVRAVNLEVTPEAASCVGALVAELVANACKHAYPSFANGDIRIGLRGIASGGFRLEVEDRGLGLADAQAGMGVGRRLIEGLTRQLGAQHAWRDANPGARFILWVGRP